MPSEINTAKQDGLYVDIADDGTPIVPSETIGDDEARAAIELARRGLMTFEPQRKREDCCAIPRTMPNW